MNVSTGPFEAHEPSLGRGVEETGPGKIDEQERFQIESWFLRAFRCLHAPEKIPTA